MTLRAVSKSCLGILVQLCRQTKNRDIQYNRYGHTLSRKPNREIEIWCKITFDKWAVIHYDYSWTFTKFTYQYTYLTHPNFVCASSLLQTNKNNWYSITQNTCIFAEHSPCLRAGLPGSSRTYSKYEITQYTLKFAIYVFIFIRVEPFNTHN